jgi:hypothetical protein
VNIVVQRLDRRFDLIVATNVFIYYDLLDQVLALGNVAAMLKPGGFLLSNNALLELPSSTIRSAGYLTSSIRIGPTTAITSSGTGAGSSGSDPQTGGRPIAHQWSERLSS